uniref:K Homology domain-containing protein n=1 Tax=Panagrolaimus sp. PS1159 TaxID=55785 RepID=A0AC35GBG0_9BILA
MSSRSASDGESTLSLGTARSSSISLTLPNSSIAGDDIDTKKNPPKRKNEQHGGAGDNIGRNYHNQFPTSHQVTTSRRRRRRRNVIPRRSKDYGTPQAPPKRHLGGSGMGGYPSSYMPMSYSQNQYDDLFAFGDSDVLLYTVKELCDLVESERFVCGPNFMAQFQVLTERILYVTRNLAQRCRQNALSPPLVMPSLYDSLLHVHSPNLLNAALSRINRESPHDESSVLPSGGRVLKSSKVMVPEHPNYNFIGRILGPRGISVRQLEDSSGCGILIRGKGSVKNAKREERLRSRNTRGFKHLKEPLHVLITAEGNDEAECNAKLEKCKRRIEKLLKPEYDEFKRRQLAQLAIINGNYDATRGIAPAI